MNQTTDNLYSTPEVQGQPTGPLDSNVNTVVQIDTKKEALERAQVNRRTRFKHLKSASELLPGSATSRCLWALSSCDYGVDLIHNTAHQQARLNGVQTCQSIWSCPVCSLKISKERCFDMNTLLAWARKSGFYPVMMTLTARHSKDHSLAELLDSMKKAHQRLLQHRAWREFKSLLLGYVTSTEVTGSGFNGWHPHFHKILIVKATSEKEAIRLVEKMAEPWFASLKGVGLYGNGNGFSVQGAAAAGAYITKWGAGEEMALGNLKKGRGGSKSPFQLLADYSENGDKYAGRLFQEYSNVFHGRKALTWSKGLKQLAHIEEKAEEEEDRIQEKIKEDSKFDLLVDYFSPRKWRKIRHRRAELLTAAENGTYVSPSFNDDEDDEKIKYSKKPTWSNGGIGGVAPDGDTRAGIQAVIYTDETDARSSVPSCHDKQYELTPEVISHLRSQLGKDIDFS